MASPTKVTVKYLKPILSVSVTDSRRRVINLYKAWYRQIPFIQYNYYMPKTEAECRAKLKEEFKRHAHVRDVRVIDVLLVKGQMELQEVTAQWIPCTTLLNHWSETSKPKPKDFMSKFLSGHD